MIDISLIAFDVVLFRPQTGETPFAVGVVSKKKKRKKAKVAPGLEYKSKRGQN